MSIGSYIVLLPDIALEKIFSFLSYDEIAKNRVVCQKFNDVGSKFLSRGFVQLEKRHSTIYKRVKSLLPRRESERRAHPLARHCDILSAVETRISMLNMTFMKYIENNLCCFIPGKVIDEIERVLSVVEGDGPPPRTHELLQELRDISSMAMEHFDEQILPNLKLQINQSPIIPILPSPSKSSKLVLVQYAIAGEVRKVKKQNKCQKIQISAILKNLDRFQKKVKRQNLRLKAQSLKIREQERKLQEQSVKILEQESTIADIKKHMDEWEQKFSDFTAEVKARDDFISKAPNKQTPTFTQSSAKYHLPNIKPRKAQVLPVTYTSAPTEIDRKRKLNTSTYEVPNKLSRSTENSDEKCAKYVENVSELLKNMTKPSPRQDVNEDNDSRGIFNRKSDFGSFISSSIETLLKNPISSIKSRKRKMSEDIDLK